MTEQERVESGSSAPLRRLAGSPAARSLLAGLRRLTPTAHRLADALRRLDPWLLHHLPRMHAMGPLLRRAWPHLVRTAGVVAVALIGSAIGAGLAPTTTTTVGPFQINLRVVPSLHPGVVLELPPAGRVEFDTHSGPVAIEAAMGEVDLEGARRLLGSRAELDELQRSAPDTLRTATIQATAITGGCALAGAVSLSLLVYRRRWRRTAQVAAALAVVLAATSGLTAATFDPDKMAQPHFTGLLSKAPYIAGQAESLLARLQSYRVGLADIVQGVTQLYATSTDLPTVPGSRSGDVITLLHVSDIHLNPIAFDLTDQLVSQFKVDLVVDTGDITTWGTEVESATLSRVGEVRVPYVFVRGNHDSRRTQAAVAASRNAVVLDGDVVTVAGVTIAGIGDPTFTPDQPESGSSGSQATATATAQGTATGTETAPVPTSGSRTVPGQAFAESPDPEVRAGNRLAGLVRNWDDEHPETPVSIAAVHNPDAATPLLGTVPLVLSGHLHRRDVSVDPATGTRVMVEGSTGGAGVTATGIAAADQGHPVPLNATLIYLARRGPRAGQVLAYDEVTVGGLGLASISLNRTVVRPPETSTSTSTPTTSTPSPSTPSTPSSLPPPSSTVARPRRPHRVRRRSARVRRGT
jgi:predicted MPP superfamily phosphohydrolase